MKQRELEIAVISDLHLGTFGCQAKELYSYLRSIAPKTLVLNGDIIDIWQFRKSYFPKSHLKVIKQIIGMASKGVKVYYLTGNHDEALRRFSDAEFGNIALRDKLVLKLDNGEKAWIFHGDIFDASIQNAKWIAKLGGWGYDLLIAINHYSNRFLTLLGRERYSFAGMIKSRVKKAVSYISNFEDAAADLAIHQNYDYVICGHIHQPQIRQVETKEGSCVYLNSGDWIENLTALEYQDGHWYVFQHSIGKFETQLEEEEMVEPDLNQLIAKITAKTA